MAERIPIGRGPLAGSNGVFSAVLFSDVDEELVVAVTAAVAEADALTVGRALVPAALRGA